MYKPPVKYTKAELEEARVADLLVDARCAEEQAEQGPYYPDRDITRESLLKYAAECRAKASRKSE